MFIIYLIFSFIYRRNSFILFRYLSLISLNNWWYFWCILRFMLFFLVILLDIIFNVFLYILKDTESVGILALTTLFSRFLVINRLHSESTNVFLRLISSFNLFMKIVLNWIFNFYVIRVLLCLFFHSPIILLSKCFFMFQLFIHYRFTLELSIENWWKRNFSFM